MTLAETLNDKFEAVTDTEAKKLKRWTLDGRGFDKSGNYITYHGTSKENAKKILKTGLKTPEGSGPRWFMLTTNPKTAKKFGDDIRSDLGTQILKVTLPKDKVVKLLWNGQETSFNDIQHGIRDVIPPKYITIEK